MILDEAKMSIQPLDDEKWLVNIGGGYKPHYYTSFDTKSVGTCVRSVEEDLQCELRYQLDSRNKPLDMVSAYMYYHPLRKYIHADLHKPGEFGVTIDPVKFVFDPKWNTFPKRFIGHISPVEHSKKNARFWWKTQAFQLEPGTDFAEEMTRPTCYLGDTRLQLSRLVAEYMVVAMTRKDYAYKKTLAKRILDLNVLEIIDKGDYDYPHYGMVARVQAGELTIRHKISDLQK